MPFVELSIENLRNETISFAKEIEPQYTPDLVAYIAMGGYLIGREMAEYFDVPLIELRTCRSGEKQKQQATTLLTKLPKCCKHALRALEMKSRSCMPRSEEKNRSANITQRYDLPLSSKKILLVDDSVDSGTSAMSAIRVLGERYPNALIEIAAFNVFSASEQVVNVRFWMYRDYLISFPSSKDNLERPVFLEMYAQDKGHVGCGKPI